MGSEPQILTFCLFFSLLYHWKYFILLLFSSLKLKDFAHDLSIELLGENLSRN
jgi:hypothetical protein